MSRPLGSGVAEPSDTDVTPLNLPSVPPQLDALANPTTAQVTWIGHSTFLLQIDGLNILTDPIFSERASPVSFAGPKRTTPPAMSVAQLPPIDIVLISHNHYDHLDKPSIKALQSKQPPALLRATGAKSLVRQTGYR